MKPVPAPFIQFLLTGQPFAIGELYTFTLQDGSQDFFTNLDIDVKLLSGIWSTNTVAAPGVAGALTALTSGDSMLPVTSLFSPNGNFELRLQADGNVVVYQAGVPLWATNTAGSGATELIMQLDGNLVLLNGSTPIWASRTNGHPGAYLQLQNDGNLVVVWLATYRSNSLRIEGLKYKLAVGWQVDEQDIKISSYPGFTLAGSNFFGGIESGLLDGAYVTRQRIFWPVVTGIAAYDMQLAPIAVVTLFTGRVSTISKIGRTHVEMKLKSPMVILDIDMPRNTYGSNCQWSLFSPGCGLNRASFTNNFTVLAANNTTIEPTVPVSPVTGADSVPYYALGRIKFTSGVNTNLIVTVGGNDASVFSLRFSLDNVPAPGDTFEASAGCAKTGRGGACETKFDNLINFRGFSRVPPIVTSV